MSKKTMEEYPDLDNLYPPPRTTVVINDDSRAKDLIAGRLDGDKCVALYHVPWDGSHGENATPDFRDAVWGVNEGKRDVRQLKNNPEMD